MTTATVEVYRDSYGKELTASAHAAREQKVQELVAKGHDRWAAENIADGRPSWSQRVTSDSRVTESEPYLAVRKHGDAVPQPDRVTLSDLEIRLDDLNAKIAYWLEAKSEAEASLKRGKKIRATASEILKGIEGKNGLDAAADRSRCEEALARVEPAIKLDERRLQIAVGLLARWRKELKEFPREDYERKRREEARRQDLRI